MAPATSGTICSDLRGLGVERGAWPPFDPRDAHLRPTYAGAIGSCLARRPDARRSANPDRSFAALGAAAVALIDPHPLDHGFGPGSPLARFVDGGGKSLLRGAPLSTVTAVHYAEYLCDVPDKQFVCYEVPLLQDGRKVWQRAEQMNRDGFVRAVQGTDHDYIEAVARAYAATGRAGSGEVAVARCHLFDAADFVAFAVADFERLYGRGQA